jgi:hypothetical protein
MHFEPTKECNMRTTPILASAAGLAITGTAFAQTSGSTKMSQAECTSLRSSLDSGKTGSISEAQSKNAVTNFTSADTDKGGKLSRTEFMTACNQGGVTSRGMTGSDTPSTPPTTK